MNNQKNIIIITSNINVKTPNHIDIGWYGIVFLYIYWRDGVQLDHTFWILFIYLFMYDCVSMYCYFVDDSDENLRKRESARQSIGHKKKQHNDQLNRYNRSALHMFSYVFVCSMLLFFSSFHKICI